MKAFILLYVCMTQDELSTLFQHYFEPIYRYTYFRIGHTQETEDLVSIIFEKAIKNHASYTPRQNASLKSWLFKIAHNTIVDYYRTKKVVDSIDAIDIPEEQSIEKDVDTSVDTERVRTLINLLPDRKREIVLLRYHGQLTYEEIAQTLGIAPNSASSLLSKALVQLREEYNSQFASL